MSVRQQTIENQIAVMAADEEHDLVTRLGGSKDDAVRAWHRVLGEILKIAEQSDAVRA